MGAKSIGLGTIRIKDYLSGKKHRPTMRIGIL